MPVASPGSIQMQEDPVFIGLQSYTEAQSAMFFGRDEEIERLTTLVKVNTLTIVFGRSGTGKTSLLNAGVFPPLRKSYCLPFPIRLEFQDGSPDLVTQIKNVLKSKIDEYGFRVENYPGPATLWEYFHKEFLWKSITPILVFDQFEEIFTPKKKPNFANDRLENFWEELSDLIENKIPDSLTNQFLNQREQITYDYKQQPVKVIFAFREEFLPEFESIPFKIPSLKYSRFRLMPMNQHQAYDVVTKTWGDKIDDAQAKKIITYLTNDDKLTSISDIEPSLLSQVCFYLDRERIAQGNDKITSQFLDEHPKETILRSIYSEVMNKSYDAVGRPPVEAGKPPSENPVKVFVEDKLITNKGGYRAKYALTESDEYLRPGIKVLKDKYFVRDDGKSVELTHDVLAPIIKEDREIRRKGIADAEAKKKARRKGIIIGIMIVAAAILIGGGLWVAAAIERSKAQKEVVEATNKRDSLNKHINDLLIDSARIKRFNDESGNNGHSSPPNNKPNFLPGVTDSTVRNSAMATAVDSAVADLKKQKENLLREKNNLGENTELLNTRIGGLISNTKKLDSINAAGKVIIAFLKKQIFDDSIKIAMLQNNLDALRKQFYQYKLENPARFKPIVRPDAWDLDSNSLKLKLYYSFAKNDSPKTSEKMTLYIIPYNNANKAIIRDAKIYEIHCNDKVLKGAKGWIPAKFSNGYYYFPNLPVGKYLIKICTYYGGYYTYNKQKSGTTTLKWDASPPIR